MNPLLGLARSAFAAVSLTAILVANPLAATAPPQAEDLLTRPDPPGSPTVVEYVLYMLDINEINSAAQHFSASLFFHVSWQDERLIDPERAVASYDLDEVWHPGLQIVNQQRLVATFAPTVVVDATGRATFRQRVWGNFSQPLDLRDFPFDSQHFGISIVCTALDRQGLELVPSAAVRSGMADDFSAPDWRVLDCVVADGELSIGPGPALPGMTITVFASRYRGYYVLKFMLPLAIILMMAWSVVWLDPTNPSARMSVSVTSILTLIAYRFMIAGHLPVISYLTRMDQLILGATLLVFSVLATVVTGSYLLQKERKGAMYKLDRRMRIAYPVAVVLVVLISFKA